MQPIVFIHGIRVSRTMWNPQLRLLHDKTAAIAIDLPGHGRRRTEPFTMTTAIEAVTDAVDTLGKPAILVGASLGGYIAYATAAAHPDHTAGIVAMGSTAVVTPARIRPYRLLGHMGGRGENLQRALIRLSMGRKPAADLTAGGLSTETVPAVLEALTNFDALAAVAATDRPVRFINGQWDWFRADEKRFIDAAGRARLTIMPRSGHLINLTRPGEVTAAIEDAATTGPRTR